LWTRDPILNSRNSHRRNSRKNPHKGRHTNGHRTLRIKTAHRGRYREHPSNANRQTPNTSTFLGQT
ncbi:hypothetical protein BGX20_007812, partial [Mortierella sp. AD010]